MEEGIIDIDRFQKKIPEQLIEKTQKDYEKIKDDYHPKSPYSWCWKIFKDELNNRNPSIFHLAKVLDLQYDYVKIYSTMSVSVHSSPLIENIIGVGKTKTLGPNFTKHIERMSFISIDYLGKIIIEILKKFSDKETIFEVENYINVYWMSLLGKVE